MNNDEKINLIKEIASRGQDPFTSIKEIKAVLDG